MNDDNDPLKLVLVYLNAVTRWMSVLLPMIRPLLYNNGGSIISVQVTLTIEDRVFVCKYVHMFTIAIDRK
jgi:hypothetical protein